MNPNSVNIEDIKSKICKVKERHESIKYVIENDLPSNNFSQNTIIKIIKTLIYEYY